ncbi:hypothetical protein E4U23_006718 [Claviceps purpurea]|nr:hypothetical protein E4U23_006718 [Claviceps purpurea]KAG6318053.1 hypothetical protein E4U44_008209 [Claviceps purpurea]
MVRPDLAFVAAKLSLYIIIPGPEHMKAADRAIRYGPDQAPLYELQRPAFGGDEDIIDTRVLAISNNASIADNSDAR